uniref:Uncharacterized protein n=1 Tax=viral metagenome TaxID=1070528 RepID=A0A6C0ECG8_9ZZZZ
MIEILILAVCLICLAILVYCIIKKLFPNQTDTIEQNLDIINNKIDDKINDEINDISKDPNKLNNGNTNSNQNPDDLPWDPEVPRAVGKTREATDDDYTRVVYDSDKCFVMF